MTATKTESQSIRDFVGVFTVMIGDLSLGFGSTARITDFVFDEEEKKANEFTLTVVCSDSETFAKVAPIAKGTKAEIRWGYLGQLSEHHKVKVYSVAPVYSDKGYAVKVKLRDYGDGLGHFKHHDVFSNTPLGHVVELLAKDFGPNGESYKVALPRDDKGVSPVAASNVPATMYTVNDVPNDAIASKLFKETANLQMNGRSPRGMLNWIAHRTGCQIKFKGDTLQFVPYPKGDAPHYLFRWRGGTGTLIAFSVHVKETGGNQAPARGTTAHGMDPLTKKAFAFTAHDLTLKGRQVLGSTAPFGGPNGTGQSMAPESQRRVSSSGQDLGAATGNSVNADFQSLGPVDAQAPPSDFGTDLSLDSMIEQEQLNGWKHPVGATIPTPSGKKTDAERNSKAMFHEAERGGITASAQILGLPTIRRGHIVRIEGLESADVGNYMVVGCQHKIDAKGYFVELKMKRHGQQKRGVKSKGKPNKTKAADPTKASIPMFLTDNKTGQIVGSGVSQ